MSKTNMATGIELPCRVEIFLKKHFSPTLTLSGTGEVEKPQNFLPQSRVKKIWAPSISKQEFLLVERKISGAVYAHITSQYELLRQNVPLCKKRKFI